LEDTATTLNKVICTQLNIQIPKIIGGSLMESQINKIQHQPKHSSRIVSRNSQIRSDYQELRSKGLKNWEAFIQLSDKYFLSENTIDKIIYTK
jgi:hypothetical protein